MSTQVAVERQAGAVVGSPLPRNDARPKVTGQAMYTDDWGFEGMLHVATARAPKPHMRLKKIGIGPARRMPGVAAILTARDVPGKNRWPLVLPDYPFLAEETTRFAGEAIALVAAEDPLTARRAAAAMELTYEELPAVFDPEEAMRPSSPKVYGEDNLFAKYVIRRGDAEAALRKADVVVEGVFTTGWQYQAYLENQAMLAVPESDGSLSVYGSMQCPYYVREAVAACLDLPLAKVRIVQWPTGGGFGGKEDVPALVGAHAALVAWKTKRPAKLVYSRSEDMISMSRRHPSKTYISYGASRDGTILACRVKYILDAGAYSTLSPIVLWRGTVHAAGPYRIPNVLVESYAVATNQAPCGAFRGFGQPQVCFANESLMDELAYRLKMDPMEIRKKNMLRVGDSTITGQVLSESCGLPEVMEKVEETSRWRQRRAELERQNEELRRRGSPLRRGIGVSCNYYGVSLGAKGRHLDRAAAHVQVENDGTVLIAIGNTEIGQGAKTVIAQIAAEALGAPYESIRVLDTDTSRVPDSGPTVASRTTLMSGNAVLDACRPIRARLDSIPDGNLSFREKVKECYKRKLKMAEQGWYDSPPTSFGFDSDGQGDAYVVYAYSANVSEVEVDTETGEVRVLCVTSAHDIGKVINPVTAQGQIEGGIAQAIGYALLEDLVSEKGILKNPNFTDYILPTSLDAPEFRTILVEHPYSAGPFGAKGLAESPIIGPAPSIANAIRHATGARMTHIPATPERVWAALR